MGGYTPWPSGAALGATSCGTSLWRVREQNGFSVPHLHPELTWNLRIRQRVTSSST